MTDNSSLFSNA
jgi:hypothetical protein